MRKLIVAEFMTLDGFIARPDGQMDFFMPFQNEKSMMVEAQKDWDLLLMGRNTYEMMVQFWPNNTNENDLIAKYMNTVSKTVISGSLKSAPWGKHKEADILNQNIPETIKKWKQEDGKNIALLGSAITSKYLLENNLVDEYFLLVYPLILGKGISLFSDIYEQQQLQLMENRNLGNGVIELKYKVQKSK